MLAYSRFDIIFKIFWLVLINYRHLKRIFLNLCKFFYIVKIFTIQQITVYLYGRGVFVVGTLYIPT